MGEEAQVNEGKTATPLATSAHRVDHTYSNQLNIIIPWNTCYCGGLEWKR
ncbi:hypothetical protein [Chitinophaga pinensis]|nr:hypothetical protein [Chitinophaga pinensis]